MNPYLTQRANRRWWVYPLMALFFALSALLLWRTCKAGERGDTHMVVLLLCLATAALYAGDAPASRGNHPAPGARRCTAVSSVLAAHVSAVGYAQAPAGLPEHGDAAVIALRKLSAKHSD